jgi:hypothetical protein
MGQLHKYYLAAVFVLMCMMCVQQLSLHRYCAGYVNQNISRRASAEGRRDRREEREIREKKNNRKRREPKTDVLTITQSELDCNATNDDGSARYADDNCYVMHSLADPARNQCPGSAPIDLASVLANTTLSLEEVLGPPPPTPPPPGGSAA